VGTNLHPARFPARIPLASSSSSSFVVHLVLRLFLALHYRRCRCCRCRRYIEVHHWPADKPTPSLADFTSWEMHTAVLETGTFTSSSALLNQIQSNCQWTARSNLMSLPTDCCQRDERRGWMGDAALGASVTAYNHDMHSFYSSFATLMADDQGQSIDGEDEGAMPNWVPVFAPKPGSKTSFPGAGAPNWMTAFPTILHTLWKHTGDTSLISRHWEQLVGYLGWYERKLRKFPSFASNPFRRTASGEISDTQFPGDWCPPPKTQGMYRDPTMNNSVDIASGLGEAECGHTGWNPDHTRYIDPALFTEKNLSSAFSYLHDKQMIAEMGAAINASAASSASVRETCALLRFLYTFVPNLSWPGKFFLFARKLNKDAVSAGSGRDHSAGQGELSCGVLSHGCSSAALWWWRCGSAVRECDGATARYPERR
jgi:hypothetical protein